MPAPLGGQNQRAILWALEDGPRPMPDLAEWAGVEVKAAWAALHSLRAHGWVREAGTELRGRYRATLWERDPLRWAVHEVEHGSSYEAAARDAGLSVDKVRQACRALGVESPQARNLRVRGTLRANLDTEGRRASVWDRIMDAP